MKNGKLFGKLNLIDLLVILVLIAAVVLVVVKLVPGSGSGDDASISVSEQSEPNLRFTVLCEDLTEQLVENVIADLENGTYTVGGEAVSPRRIFNSGEILDGEVVAWHTEANDEGTMNLYVTVEANATTPDGVYTLQYQEIRLGKSYIVKTLGIELTGCTVSMEKLQ